MNNRNWIAVFLGLACLVLFVSVMGASGNWLTNNNDTNNGATPQQINQTVRGMNEDTRKPDEKLPTEIDANGITDTITGNGDSNNTSTTNNGNNANNNNNNNNSNNMPNLLMPQMGQ